MKKNNIFQKPFFSKTLNDIAIILIVLLLLVVVVIMNIGKYLENNNYKESENGKSHVNINDVINTLFNNLKTQVSSLF